MNEDIIKHYEDVALSDKQLLKIINGNAKLVLYPDLKNYSSIDEVLGTHTACILLFEAKKNYGHWCCLWKLNNSTVSFFNPYGGYPDASLKHIPEHFARISNQDYPYLSLLLYNSPYKLTYNERQYQEKNKNIKTCGRHCGVRLICRNMSDDQYYNYMKYFTSKYHINNDQFVTLLTIDISKS